MDIVDGTEAARDASVDLEKSLVSELMFDSLPDPLEEPLPGTFRLAPGGGPLTRRCFASLSSLLLLVLVPPGGFFFLRAFGGSNAVENIARGG